MKLSLGGFSTVTMTDRWFQELRAGRAFSGSASQGAVAGEYSHVQLLNPAGSGVQAIVAQLRAKVAVASTIELRLYDTGLTTDAGAVANLLAGGAAGASHVRRQTNVAGLGSTLSLYYLAANTPTVLWPSWGPELAPGKGVLVLCATVNIEMTLEFLVNEV